MADATLDANRTSAPRRPARPVIVVRIAIALGIVAVLSTRNLQGWEEDLHYLLTFWLADHAGFSRADANTIAEGARRYDESTFFSAIGGVFWAVLTNDYGAAESVRDRHFASDGPLPSPPQRRAVRPNSPSARRAAEAALLQQGDRLLELGEALHSLQDSWSHQGVPDVPFGVNEQYAFGHPRERGGWLSHSADKTHLHLEDAVATARATYDVMLKYLDTRPRKREHAADPWTKLEGSVREFAGAKNRGEKDRWASRHIPEDARAALVPLDGLGRPSLLGPGEPAFAAIGLRYIDVACNGCSGAGGLPMMPEGLEQTAKSFFDTWVARHDVAGARQFFDLPSIKSLMGSSNIQSDVEVIEWIDRFLTIQLMLDHERIDALGHGDPRSPGYRELPLRPSASGWNVRPAASLNVSAFDFVESKSLGWVVALRDNAVADDYVGMTWQRISGQWKITRAVAIPLW
jgi:hypothetical protein